MPEPLTLEDLLERHAPELELHKGYIARSPDGQLFLAGGGHDTFLYKTGNKRLPDRCFGEFDKNLKARKAYSTRRGARYLHAVVPDKESVATGSLPAGLKLTSLIDTYKAHCRQSFLDLRPDRPVPGYFKKVDTHWAIPGEIDAAGRIARAFGIGEPEIAAGIARLKAAVTAETFEAHGDLGLQFEPYETELQPNFDAGWTTSFYINPVGIWNDGKTEIYRSPASPPRRLLIFGDSFIHNACRMLTPFFETILFCRSEFYHREMVDMMRPSHILTEQVERFLERIRPDTEAGRFLLIPFVNGTGIAPTQAYWVALDDVLTPFKPAPWRGWRAFFARMLKGWK